MADESPDQNDPTTRETSKVDVSSADPTKRDTARVNMPGGDLESNEIDKSQTVRINVPPTADSGDIKRETVRITPGAPGVAPKKESTRLQVPGALPTVKPLAPPSPLGVKPPGAMPPPAPPKPVSSVPPPSPPKPTAPGMVEAPPVTMKASAPKKETARIQIPPDPKPRVPQATVKMQQPPPIVKQPPTASLVPAATVERVETAAAAVEDAIFTPLSIGVFLISLITLVISYMAYSA